MNNKIINLYNDSKLALIEWIDENHDSIDEYIATFTLKDGATLTIYDINTYFNGCAINSIQSETIHHLAHEDMLILKERNE